MNTSMPALLSGSTKTWSKAVNLPPRVVRPPWRRHCDRRPAPPPVGPEFFAQAPEKTAMIYFESH